MGSADISPPPNEYQPPELPNSIATRDKDLGRQADSAVLTVGGIAFPVTPATPTDFEVKDASTIAEVDPFASGDAEGGEKAKLSARKPVYEPEPGAATPRRIFAEGVASRVVLPDPGESFGEMSTLSSFSGGRSAGNGSGFGGGSGGGAAGNDESALGVTQIQGASAAKDRVLRREVPVKPGDSFDERLAAVDALTRSESLEAKGKDMGMGGGFGGGLSEDDEASTSKSDKDSPAALAKNGTGSLSLSNRGDTYTGSTSVSGGTLEVKPTGEPTGEFGSGIRASESNLRFSGTNTFTPNGADSNGLSPDPPAPPMAEPAPVVAASNQPDERKKTLESQIAAEGQKTQQPNEITEEVRYKIDSSASPSKPGSSVGQDMFKEFAGTPGAGSGPFAEALSGRGGAPSSQSSDGRGIEGEIHLGYNSAYVFRGLDLGETPASPVPSSDARVASMGMGQPTSGSAVDVKLPADAPVEFEGYIGYGSPIAKAPAPRSGQTTGQIANADQLPILGDVPLIGRLFDDKESGQVSEKKTVLPVDGIEVAAQEQHAKPRVIPSAPGNAEMAEKNQFGWSGALGDSETEKKKETNGAQAPAASAPTAIFESPLRTGKSDVSANEETNESGVASRKRLQSQDNKTRELSVRAADGKYDDAKDRLERTKDLAELRNESAIDKAVDTQDYMDAKRELDTSQEMLNTMKLKLMGETIQERIPSNSIVVHEDPVIDSKGPGFLSFDRRFESTALIQLRPRTPGIAVPGKERAEQVAQGQMTPQFFATEAEIAKSRNVLTKVAEQLELPKRWEMTPEQVLEELKKSIEFTNRPGTDLVDLKVRNASKEDARDIAAEVAKAYKNSRAEIEARDSERALQEFRKAVRDQEDKVEERRKLVTAIARTKGIIPTVRSGDQAQLENQKAQLESQIKSLLNYSSDQLLVYASGLDLPDNRIKSLYPQYLEQKRSLDQIKTKGLADNHPSVQAQTKRLGDLRKQLEEGVTELRESLMTKLDSTSTQLEKERAIAPQQLLKTPKPAPHPAPIPTDEIAASGEAFSTFSLHVSDASFKVAKAALDRGERPDPESLRPEEFYNAFDYGDPTPAPGEAVACAIEQAAHPILPQRNLVRIAMRTGAAGRAASQPLALTVLLDHSGSMEREDRHEGLNQAMIQLASLLKAGDTITVAGFSRTPRLMADRLPGDQAKKLIEIVRNTPSEGGTNLEEALKLGGELALRQKNPAAQNRIVLLTDGAANLGNAKPEDLAERIRQLRQQGISFDAAGLGAGGVNDRMLETLTRDGNGRYYLIDQPSDADANFAKQLAGAFRPAAENVKVQVHFNPARVGRYKLIGFEKHRLKTEDFRNDKVDAAELAAEEAGIALYQVELLPQGTGEIGEASVRFHDAATNQMVEQSWTIPYDEKTPAFDQAPPSMQLASFAALTAEKLRGGPLAEAIDFQSLTPQIAKVRAHYATSKRVGDLIEMIGKLK